VGDSDLGEAGGERGGDAGIDRGGGIDRDGGSAPLGGIDRSARKDEGPVAGPWVQDPGLQAERTRLAWARTSLAMAVVGALELHVGGGTASLVGRLPGALMVLLAAGCWAHGGRRYRRITRALAAGRLVAEVGGPIMVALALIPAVIALWSLLA